MILTLFLEEVRSKMVKTIALFLEMPKFITQIEPLCLLIPNLSLSPVKNPKSTWHFSTETRVVHFPYENIKFHSRLFPSSINFPPDAGICARSAELFVYYGINLVNWGVKYNPVMDFHAYFPLSLRFN